MPPKISYFSPNWEADANKTTCILETPEYCDNIVLQVDRSDFEFNSDQSSVLYCAHAQNALSEAELDDVMVEIDSENSDQTERAQKLIFYVETPEYCQNILGM